MLHDDLVEMLDSLRRAEHALFGRLPDEELDRPMPGDSWSPKDVHGHLAAWRAIEARRLYAAAGAGEPLANDPTADDAVDEANARLHAERRARPRQEIEREADESIAALAEAIRASSTEVLCECDQLAAGIGANGINHAIGHLGDIARLTGDEAAFAELSGSVEQVLQRNHLLPRDSGVMLYNLACHRALSGEMDGARRLLRGAFGKRRDLLEWAREDPDVALLREELDALSG